MNGCVFNMNTCCTCLKVCIGIQGIVNLNSASSRDVSYKVKLKSCVPEMILEDCDDYILCNACSINLDAAYLFRCMCLQTYNKLQEDRSYNITSVEQKCIQSYKKDEETVGATLNQKRISKAQNEPQIEIVKDELGLLLSQSLNVGIEDANIFKNHIGNVSASNSNALQFLELNYNDEVEQDDSELIKNACRTIPELRNYTLDSFKCWVTLERISSPVSFTPHRRSKFNGSKEKKYWCHICKRYLKTRKHRFQEHILRHSNIKAYKCRTCSERFFSRDSMYNHERKCRGAVNVPSNDSIDNQIPMDVDECSSIVPDLLLEDDFDSSDNECLAKKKEKGKLDSDCVFSCEICNFETIAAHAFKTHMLRHNNTKPFPCTKCTKTYADYYGLQRHIRTIHPNTTPDMGHPRTRKRRITEESELETTIATPVISDIRSCVNEETETFPCRLCCKVNFESMNLLALHMTMHKDDFMCVACNKIFISERQLHEHKFLANSVKNNAKQQDQQNKVKEEKKEEDEDNDDNGTVSSTTNKKAPVFFKKHNRKRFRKKYFCKICKIHFSTKDHENTHTGAKPYRCDYCERPFGTYSVFRRHMLRCSKLHPKKTFTCEMCTNNFVNRKQLYSHKCETPSGETVYRCQICKNAFVGRAALVEHMALHIRENEEEEGELFY